MDGLVPLAVVVREVLFCYGMHGVILDGSRTPDLGLVLDSVEDFIDEESEHSKLLYRLIEDREHLSLVRGMPLVSILGGRFMQKL